MQYTKIRTMIMIRIDNELLIYYQQNKNDDTKTRYTFTPKPQTYKTRTTRLGETCF